VTQFVVGGTPYPAGSTVTITGVGTIVIYSNGVFTFTPLPNFNGAVPYIPYTISDGNGGTASANLIITVNPVNDPPVAVDDYNTIPEDTQATGNVLTNDTDPENDPLIVTQFTVGGTTYPAGTTAIITGVGTIVINSNGTYTFTPLPNYNGTVPPVDYTISDGNGGTDVGTLYITVTPVNDPPVAVVDYNSTPEDTPVTGTVAANDYDVDGNLNPNGFAEVTGPTHGILSFSSNGTYTYTPNTNFNGIDTFIYSVCDLGMPIYCDTAIVYITVLPVNDPPVTFGETYTTCSDIVLNGNVLANGDYDPDGTALTVNTTPVTGPSHGTFIIAANGAFTYTPNTNYNGPDQVIVSVCDNGIPLPPACTNDIINITVNQAIASIAGTAQNLCNSTNTTLAGNDPTPGTGLWTLVSGPNFPSITNPTLFNTTVTSMVPGIYVFRWTLSNGICSPSESLVTINNYALPTVATVGATQNQCGTLVSGSLGGNTPLNGTGSWSIISGGTGTFSSPSSGNSTFTADAYGTYLLRWSISNGVCAVSTADIIITYFLAPTVASVGSTQNLCNTLVSNDLGGNTPAIGTGLWSIVSGGTGTFSDATSGSSTFTADSYGTYVLRWSISNGTCGVSSADITVNFYLPIAADAGPDQSLCSANSTFLIGNTPASGSGIWTVVSGPNTPLIFPATGPFVLVTGLIPDITPYVFRYTINNGNCTSSDDMIVTNFIPPTLAFAGPDQSICNTAGVPTKTTALR
jgi:CshA-type fibril repeat protein